ncbi:MAG: hypothetical protein WD512_03605, partial [Candidatus Paceibacterota bacterium]
MESFNKEELQNIENRFSKVNQFDTQVVQNRAKVLICTPSIRQTVPLALAKNLIYWKMDPRYEIDWITVENLFPLDNARNVGVKEFLKTDYEYIWWIDDDVVPPKHALHKLVSSGKDIIGGVAFSMRQEN